MIWLKICIVGVVVVVFTFCAFCADVWADTIYLKDGSVIKGTISFKGEAFINLHVDIPVSPAVREAIQKNKRIDFSNFGSWGSLWIPTQEISEIKLSGIDKKEDSEDSKVSTPPRSTLSFEAEALIEKIEALKTELKELKAQVKALQARIEKLEGKETTSGTTQPKVNLQSPVLQKIRDNVTKGIEGIELNKVNRVPPTTLYIGNSNSLKFHRPDCQWAKKDITD